MAVPVWSLEQLVNTTTGFNELDVDVTALANGGYVVAWQGTDPDVGVASTFAQVFDASGSPVGPELLPSEGTIGTQPTVVSLADGTFVMAWYGSGSNWGIHCQRFEADGTPIGGVFSGSTDTDPLNDTNQLYPSMTALEDGGFAIAYSSDEDGGTIAIKVDRFDATGTKVGATIVAAVGPASEMGLVNISEVEDGGLAVTWSSGPAGDMHVYGRMYDDAGAPQTAAFPIADYPPGQQWSPASANEGNNLLVAWFDTATSEIHGKILDASGNEVKAQFVISDNSQNGNGSATLVVTALPQGGYFVMWRDYLVNDASIVGQFLDADGNKVGGEHLLVPASMNMPTVQSVAVSALEDGRIVLAWAAEYTTGDDTVQGSIHSMIVDPRGGIIEGTDEDDVLLGSVDGTADIITAKEGNDAIFGLDGNDTIYGNGGNDTLDGSFGADSMVGGSGDDFYVVGEAGDTIVETVGGGTDTILVTGMNYTLAAGVEVEVIEMEGDNDSDITGNEFGQWLKGDWSNNKLMGMGGDDTLEGGANVDWLEGGEGDDLYIVDNVMDVVFEEYNAGNDTVESDITFDLEFRDNVENLTLTGNAAIDGTGNALANEITGNSNDNYLRGLGGNDTLDGGLGADTLRGGGLDDTYFVDADDEIIEFVSEGIDTVNAAFTYTLGDHLEKLNLLGGAQIDGHGNALSNTLTGNSASNKLYGGVGNDTLNGQGGNDTMEGGQNNDTYIVAQAGDVVTEAANEGFDTVRASFNYTLGANVEGLVLVTGTNATGNTLANALTGNAGANLLDGKAGNDTMTGLAGNDHYIVANAGDVVVEAAGGGFDTVTSYVDHTLAANVEKLVLAGTAAKGTGNGLANTLLGNAAANTLKGGSGSDTIDGGGGKDVLEGGKGSDTYVLRASKDKVVDKSGADDTISSTSSRKLADYKGIENLTLAGTGNAKGTGNAAANDLVGNSGNNQLKGGGGGDMLAGGLGRDLLWGESGKDIFDFNSIAEIGKGKSVRDVIRDFDGLDRIDLSTIDANLLAGGNNKFKFLAQEGSKFGGIAGQLIWDKQDKSGTSKDVTLVSGDLNGDKIADFTLELSGLHNLNKGDFIL